MLDGLARKAVCFIITCHCPIYTAPVQVSTDMRMKQDGSLITYFNCKLQCNFAFLNFLSHIYCMCLSYQTAPKLVSRLVATIITMFRTTLPPLLKWSVHSFVWKWWKSSGIKNCYSRLGVWLGKQCLLAFQPKCQECAHKLPTNQVMQDHGEGGCHTGFQINRAGTQTKKHFLAKASEHILTSQNIILWEESAEQRPQHLWNPHKV